MKVQTALPIIVALVSGAQAASTIVRWHGCGGENQQTQTNGDDCTNVSGFKTDNLCKVEVPPPGTDRCEFYTTMCGNPFGTTYYCNAGQTCDASSWEAIDSYRCYQQGAVRDVGSDVMGMSLVVGRMRGARVDFSLQLVLCIQFIPTLDVARCDRLLAPADTAGGPPPSCQTGRLTKGVPQRPRRLDGTWWGSPGARRHLEAFENSLLNKVRQGSRRGAEADGSDTAGMAVASLR
ncbi:hypothetical protein PCL_09416 [Purpureocillium lilacinum]|uniref:Uncharacterized protein n=2 Tax=Purpureocillium lilacinum TaxID=33203 RepID=A0A2U3EI77_PURLI|nr:hypothetical protein PCL_09416 [Purpureocillium lilacinum]